jgi:hypothetical protein
MKWLLAIFIAVTTAAILYNSWLTSRANREMRRLFSGRDPRGANFDSRLLESSEAQRLWRELEAVLKYPFPGSMRMEDSISDIMAIHNSLRLHWVFEDEIEILELIDSDLADFARKEKAKLRSVNDIMILLDAKLSARP